VVTSNTDSSIAYRKLREMILRTELKPGEVLVERELMERLSVGRTPLRDALHLLAHEGLVDIMPRRGTSVSQVTLSDLQQIFELRAGIERIVAQAAVERVTDDDLAELHDLLERAQATTGSVSDVDIDGEFHQLLLRISGNRYLGETYRRLFDASLRLLYLTNCGMEPTEDQVRTLEDTETALRGRNAEALGDLLVDHVRAFRDRVSGSIFSDQRVA
jgi:GntR family transcriptional regulator, rspAB operon transcriptional repressor